MGNALRFIRYTFTGIRVPRHKHGRGLIRQNATAIIAGFGGAMLLTLPVWMILMGVI